MRRVLPILFCLGWLAGCQPEDKNPALFDHGGDGAKYKAALVEMIERSDRIVVTEHSSALDLPEAAQPPPPVIVYGMRELDEQQKSRFLAIARNMSPETQSLFAACVPAMHHTVTFYAEGKPPSKMRICFSCGLVDWDATTRAPPVALYAGLAELIKLAGFRTTRDWKALVQKHGSQPAP